MNECRWGEKSVPLFSHGLVLATVELTHLGGLLPLHPQLGSVFFSLIAFSCPIASESFRCSSSPVRTHPMPLAMRLISSLATGLVLSV